MKNHRIAKYSAITISLLVILTWALPQAQGQKNRAYTRNKSTGMTFWAKWKPSPCGRCEGKKKTECGTCNGGRKKLPMKCPECRGKKLANCRECFGKGIYSDPFLTVACPRCEARGVIKCWRCNGVGRLIFRDGKEGPKCKVCKKKGYFKCWVCKSKGSLELYQPAGTSYPSADSGQINAVSAKIKPLFERFSNYVGPEKNPTRSFSGVKYNNMMDALCELFPQFKMEAKKTNDMGKKALKHRNVTGVKKSPGLIRHWSASAVRNFLANHMNIIDACRKLFETNKRQEEFNRRRREESGGK